MLSVLDLFRIGIGPSSSHTVGPIRIAGRFVDSLKYRGLFDATARIRVRLRGSLAFTGQGHGTPRATLLGLMGMEPETLDPDSADDKVARVYVDHVLGLGGVREVDFNPDRDLLFDYDTPAGLHPNEMWLAAYDGNGKRLRQQTYYSTGGGFIASKAQLQKPAVGDIVMTGPAVPYPFTCCDELLDFCKKNNLAVHHVIYANEDAVRPRATTDAALDHIMEVMMACIDRGLNSGGLLPGSLKVKRRAPGIWQKIRGAPLSNEREQLFDWLNVYAMAVNEENAAGGRIVTAPTNGAAG
ncbi:MAG: L-serine ammonia-lyase, iron-sulfur-dependent, subunit alpha, partial [Hyphomonadaceae bacterium]|nr:L-serine ammonia-lyase, iron-sulfur-dependent, subunit alpha [Hyphomonadaceae bacterium]